ncbi:MAG: ABC transporter ATP-binding protein [candidate division Zixibacteria bacterium]|nr:ABC transporter ATP-binding protein [candidate division Zixibacteria bacterium]
MLEIDNLEVAYGAVRAVKGISLNVAQGKIVTMIGANGAGKSSTLRAISGITRTSGGRIRFDGRDITTMPAHKIVALGISQAPEGRMIFANLTARENLAMGAYLRRDTEGIEKDMDYVFAMFPKLKDRIDQPGGKLSGGEQQMLAIARALLARPRLLLLDEPSLGIAPILVRTIFEKIVEINRELGTTILLVEQNARMALSIADYAYVLETGEVRLHGNAAEIASDDEIRKAYLGER